MVSTITYLDFLIPRLIKNHFEINSKKYVLSSSFNLFYKFKSNYLDTNMTYILGLCTMDTSSAALLKDGKVIAAVEEERLSRIKNDGSFPHLAITEVLSIENIKLQDVSEIAIYWKPWRVFTRGLGTVKKLLVSTNSRKGIQPRLEELFFNNEKSMNGSWSDLFRIKKILRTQHGKFNCRIKFWDHHHTHQMYGEAMKDWKVYASLSYDGGGEDFSTIVSIVKYGKREVLTRHKWPNSLGHFYSTFTGFLGFKMLEGEYKMMGLAPYGDPKYKDLILDKVIKLLPNGNYKLDTELCDYHAALRGFFSNELMELFGAPRKDVNKPTQKHIDIASSVQSAFEETLIHILQPVSIKFPEINKLVICGGCALNVTANGKLLTSTKFKEIIIPPAPNDAGCAIGAALCSDTNSPDFESLRSPYQGRKYSNEDIQTAIEKGQGLIFDQVSDYDLIERTAEILASGKLVAWFQGRSEFGPRALGARSFLADPRSDAIRDEINVKIKKRELFRPFAPSVTEEKAADYFCLNQNSPYMNIVANVLSGDIPAVTHTDTTARVHTVSAQSNPKYYSLLKRFGEITNVPVLLNTSFNIQEPIVYSPDDAINTFINSGVDFLVIENFIISRAV
ncbi:MAG: hypothetical protein CMM53_01720 [Rhodospirillaceae bacterium]|nr:hypothetical protein [Rhodospirillaceae bacterium]